MTLHNLGGANAIDHVALLKSYVLRAVEFEWVKAGYPLPLPFAPPNASPDWGAGAGNGGFARFQESRARYLEARFAAWTADSKNTIYHDIAALITDLGRAGVILSGSYPEVALRVARRLLRYEGENLRFDHQAAYEAEASGVNPNLAGSSQAYLTILQAHWEDTGTGPYVRMLKEVKEWYDSFGAVPLPVPF